MKSKGFSLIELMIAVAVVGILAVIAFPSYQNSVIKGNRAVAKAFLLEVSQREQQYLLDNHSYTATFSQLNVAKPTEYSRFYQDPAIVVAGPPPGFTITATPIAGSRQAKDGWIAITNTGVKTSQFTDKW